MMGRGRNVETGTEGNRRLGPGDGANDGSHDSPILPRQNTGNIASNGINFSILRVILLFLLPLAVILYWLLRERENKTNRVAVLVLGDIGRSPRMQNHAVSFARAGWDVDIIGFRGKSLTKKS